MNYDEMSELFKMFTGRQSQRNSWYDFPDVEQPQYSAGTPWYNEYGKENIGQTFEDGLLGNWAGGLQQNEYIPSAPLGMFDEFLEGQSPVEKTLAGRYLGNEVRDMVGYQNDPDRYPNRPIDEVVMPDQAKNTPASRSVNRDFIRNILRRYLMSIGNMNQQGY